MTTTRTDVLQYRLRALASQARSMANKLDAIADRPPQPNAENEKELRAIEDSFDVTDRLRIRDLQPKLSEAA